MADMTEQVGLGGGCHWCTEAVFQVLNGVQQVEQGHVCSIPPDDAYSEAVIVSFDPGVITLGDLLEVHLRTHASTANHAMREKYRSAVYAYSAEQVEEVSHLLDKFQADFQAPLVTRVLAFGGFKASPEQFRDYARKHAGKQFCQRHIDPKLASLGVSHPHLVNKELLFG